MNIVDLVIIVLLLLGAVDGYKKGFVGSLVGVAGSIIGLVAAYKYYAVFEKWLDGRLGIEKALGRFIGEHVTLPQAVSQFKLGDSLFNDVGSYLEGLQFNPQIKAQLLTYLDKIEKSVGGSLQLSLNEIVYQYLAVILLSTASFLFIWFAANLVLQILAAFFRSLINTTPIGSLDRLGGIVTGAVISALFVMVIIGLFTPLITMAGIADLGLLAPVIRGFENSAFVPFFLSCFTFFFSKLII